MVAPIVAAIAPLVPKILESVFGWIDKSIPDKAEAAKAKVELQNRLMDAFAAMDAQQVSLNLADAQSGDRFRSGWRPFIGWVCASALAFQFVVAPLGAWVLGIFGVVIPPPPTLDAMLWQLVVALLGLSGLRSVEKIKGL